MIANGYHGAMRIEEERRGEVSLLRIEGELDGRTLPDAARALDAELAGLRTRLVFDLAGLTLVTSSTISYLIDAAQRTRAHGGDAVLSRPTKLLKKSLAVLNLDSYFAIYEDDEAACAHFERVEKAPEPPAPPPADWREKFRFWKKG
jgi:anti-anti-sigma factor